MPRPDSRAAARGAAIAALLVGVLALAGCTTDPAPAPGPKALVQPIQRSNQRARVAGHTPRPQPAVLSYCYSALINTPEQLQVEAEESCEELGGRLAYYGEDALLTPCPLLQPVRATFLCHPGESRTIRQPRQRLPSIQDPTEEQQRQEELLLR